MYGQKGNQFRKDIMGSELKGENFSEVRKIWFAFVEPAISHDSHHASLVQWTTCLLPITRDPGSNPLGGLMWNRDSPVSVVSLHADNFAVWYLNRVRRSYSVRCEYKRICSKYLFASKRIKLFYSLVLHRSELENFTFETNLDRKRIFASSKFSLQANFRYKRIFKAK